MLFSRKLSPEYEYARGQTPDYEFLNRSPRAAVETIRTLIETWWSRIPASEQSRLEASLKSHKNIAHWSAFFELYCHELLLRNGFSVNMHSPELQSRAKDFRATRDAQTIEVEAAVCTDSGAIQSKRTLLDRLTDYIDEHGFVPGFRYGLEIDKSGPRLPPLKSLTSSIKTWAEIFDRKEVRRLSKVSNGSKLPVRSFTESHWTLTVTLIPRTSDETKNEVFRKAIGIGPVYGGQLHHDAALRNSLKSKASHYRQHNVPFLIAIDTIFDFPMHDEIDVMQALLGTEQIVEDVRAMKQRLTRAPDGLWIGPQGPRYRRVSAVLLVNQLRSWSIPKAGITLYLNPWAERPVPPGLIDVRTITWDLSKGRKSETLGREPWQIFGLQPSWPSTEETVDG